MQCELLHALPPLCASTCGKSPPPPPHITFATGTSSNSWSCYHKHSLCVIKKTHTEEKKGFTITFFNRPSETDKKTLHDGTNNADSIYPPQTAAAAKHIFYAFRLEGSPLTGNKRLIIISVTSLTNNGTHKKNAPEIWSKFQCQLLQLIKTLVQLYIVSDGIINLLFGVADEIKN